MTVFRRAGARTDDPTRRRVRQTAAAVSAAHRAMLVLFAVNGLSLTAWVARMPATRDALGVTPGQLGQVLLVAALAGLVTTVLLPALVTRIGAPRSILLSGAVFAIAYVLLGVGVATGSIALVAVGLAVHGMAFSGGNLPLNIESTAVERAVGRPILPQFHAAFSIGAILGSLLAAACVGLGIGLPAQLGGMAVMAVVSRWWAVRYLQPFERRPSAATRRRRATTPASSGRPDPAYGLRHAWRESRTLLIGALGFAAVVSEIVANDWLALAVVDGFATSETIAAAALSLFVGAMTLVRLFGSPILARLGRVRTLRIAAVVGMAGVLAFVFAPHPAVAVLGVLAWGAGSALNMPIAVSAASDDPAKAAYRVSVMSSCTAAAAITAPLALGALGEVVGVRSAIAAVAVGLAVVLVVSPATRVEAPEVREVPDAGRLTEALPEPVGCR